MGTLEHPESARTRCPVDLARVKRLLWRKPTMMQDASCPQSRVRRRANQVFANTLACEMNPVFLNSICVFFATHICTSCMTYKGGRRPFSKLPPLPRASSDCSKHKRSVKRSEGILAISTKTRQTIACPFLASIERPHVDCSTDHQDGEPIPKLIWIMFFSRKTGFGPRSPRLETGRHPS